MAQCRRCLERGKLWGGGDARCAFESGFFSGENWNCATANALRETAIGDITAHSDDQWAAVLANGRSDGRFLILGWYKNRGNTEFMALLDGNNTKTLSLWRAELFLGDHADEEDDDADSHLG